MKPNKVTCTKKYIDLPFAHRQHNHNGHCAWIHGHNWTFVLTFEADALDENGFVVDFGKLKWIKAWLEGMFDHTLVLNDTDPHLAYLSKHLIPMEDSHPWFAKIVTVPNCGAEGLARWVCEQINEKIARGLIEGVEQTTWLDYKARNMRLVKVEAQEDSKNSATFELASM